MNKETNERTLKPFFRFVYDIIEDKITSRKKLHQCKLKTT